jgi:hypothetical protein
LFESPHTPAEHKIKANALDGCVKQPLVASELLKCAHACAGPDDGDKVAWLHLLVHEFFQRFSDCTDALKRHANIVYHQRNRAANLLGMNS